MGCYGCRPPRGAAWAVAGQAAGERAPPVYEWVLNSKSHTKFYHLESAIIALRAIKTTVTLKNVIKN